MVTRSFSITRTLASWVPAILLLHSCVATKRGFKTADSDVLLQAPSGGKESHATHADDESCEVAIRSGETTRWSARLSRGGQTFSFYETYRLSLPGKHTWYGVDHLGGLSAEVSYDSQSRVTQIRRETRGGTLFERETFAYEDTHLSKHETHSGPGYFAGLTLDLEESMHVVGDERLWEEREADPYQAFSRRITENRQGLASETIDVHDDGSIDYYASRTRTLSPSPELSEVITDSVGRIVASRKTQFDPQLRPISEALDLDGDGEIDRTMEWTHDGNTSRATIRFVRGGSIESTTDAERIIDGPRSSFRGVSRTPAATVSFEVSQYLDQLVASSWDAPLVSFPVVSSCPVGVVPSLGPSYRTRCFVYGSESLLPCHMTRQWAEPSEIWDWRLGLQ